MNILLINLPSRRGVAGFTLPLGLIYAGSIIERAGHKVVIVDPYLDDLELVKFDAGDFKKIDDAISAHNPAIIGYGGIATSYGRAKVLSGYIKKKYPGILQVSGGPLASTYKLLLTKTCVDIVFHGETEVSLPEFLGRFRDKGNIYDTPGISYLKDGRIIKNPMPEQIKDLDTVPIPSFDLVDVKKYLVDAGEALEGYSIFHKDNPYYESILDKMKGKKHYITIVTSRGCTHRCSFCYRHVRGIRQHSVGYVIKFIKYLIDKYNIRGFAFGDELFNSNIEWVLNFCDALEREKIDIFYRVIGARADKINERTLTRLRETGCVSIHYGQESGSDLILKEYGKGVTRARNTETTLLTKKIGLFTMVQIVIGSPGETNETIEETIQFLKDVDAYQYSLNYVIPLPETPLWDYAEKRGLIYDAEKYLDLVAESGGVPIVNLTKEPAYTWKRWPFHIKASIKLHYHKRSGITPHYYAYRILYKLEEILEPFMTQSLKKVIPGWLKRI